MKSQHAPSRRRTKWLGRMLVSCSVLAAGFAIAEPAHAVSGITITHNPPASGTAGDGLTLSATFNFACETGFQCSDRVERLHYTAYNGVQKVIERQFNPSTTGSAADTWVVTVPGAEVGFPSLRYYFTASMNARLPAALATEATRLSMRAPVGNGYFTVSVDNRLRVRVTGSDGQPVANSPATIWGQGHVSAYWEARTDSQGYLDFLVPRDNAMIQSVTQGEKQTALNVMFFTGAAPTAVEAGTPVDVAGLGTVVAWQLNLGRADQPVVAEVQDNTVKLKPMTVRHYNPVDSQAASNRECGMSGWGTQLCKWTTPLAQQNMPVARNLGGGVDVQGHYVYSTSVKTTATRAYSVKRGEWFEGDGKVHSEKEKAMEGGSTLQGPQWAKDFAVPHEYYMQHVEWCSVPSCRETKYTVDVGWTGGTWESYTSSSNYFDEACDPATGKCNDFTTTFTGYWKHKQVTSNQRELGFQIDLSPYEWAPLTAGTEYSYKSDLTDTVTVTFTIVANDLPYHYLSIPHGALSGRRLETDPGWVYTTASANWSLSNSVAQDPNALICVSCEGQPIA